MSRALWIEIIAGLLYVLVIGPIGGGLLSGLDRLVSARMQGRQGPPIRQAFFDLSKLFQKRAGIVNHFQSILVVGHMVFVVFTGILIYTGNDFLLSLFTLTLGEMFFCMAAASASGPYSGMGSQRELVQLMCTEPMLLIMAIGFYLFLSVHDTGCRNVRILHGPCTHSCGCSCYCPYARYVHRVSDYFDCRAEEISV